jgi:hypothetical protein
VAVADHISEKTHVNLTIGVLISGLFTVGGFIWNAASMASDVAATKIVAEKTSETTATLATTAALTAQTIATQQKILDQQAAALKEGEERDQQVRDALIRIEEKLGNRH